MGGVAGRAKSRLFKREKGIRREKQSFRLDPRLIEAVRTICARARQRCDGEQPSLSATFEGLVWWGIYCASNHREETNPFWTYEEAKQAGLVPILKNPRIGELKKGRFVKDYYGDPQEIGPLPTKRLNPTRRRRDN